MRTEMLCISVLRVASGPRVKLASCKSALNRPPPPPSHTHTPVVYFTDCSKAVVPVLVLLCGVLWFILRGDLLYVLPCAILFLCFSVPFSIAITSLGEERANLSVFRMFDRFVLVWVCRFLLPLGVWEGLRFVIVALPGLLSYLFILLAVLRRCLILRFFVVYSMTRFVLCLAWYHFVLVFSSPFSIAITSLGE